MPIALIYTPASLTHLSQRNLHHRSQAMAHVEEWDAVMNCSEQTLKLILNAMNCSIQANIIMFVSTWPQISHYLSLTTAHH